MNPIIETVAIVSAVLLAVSFFSYWRGFEAARRECESRRATAAWALRSGGGK